MKIYITNYSQQKIDGVNQRLLYVHYFRDCKKLNADYIEDDLYLPNSGVREIEIKKEKLFSVLQGMGYFSVCKDCEFRLGVEAHDEFEAQK